LLLSHSLAAVVSESVRNLVADHGGQTGIADCNRLDCRVHGDLPARQAEGIHLPFIDDVDFPVELRRCNPNAALELGALRGFDQSAGNLPDRFDGCTATLDVSCAQDFVIGLNAQSIFLLGRQCHDLSATEGAMLAAADHRQADRDQSDDDRNQPRPQVITASIRTAILVPSISIAHSRDSCVDPDSVDDPTGADSEMSRSETQLR